MPLPLSVGDNLEGPSSQHHLSAKDVSEPSGCTAVTDPWSCPGAQGSIFVGRCSKKEQLSERQYTFLISRMKLQLCLWRLRLLWSSNIKLIFAYRHANSEQLHSEKKKTVLSYPDNSPALMPIEDLSPGMSNLWSMKPFLLLHKTENCKWWWFQLLGKRCPW